MSTDAPGAVTWTPTEADIARARMTGFMRWLRDERGVELTTYRELWRWSVDEVSAFWECIAQYFDLVGDGWRSPALADERMPGAIWFPDARLNFAENVLRAASDRHRHHATAILHLTEDDDERRISWRELAEQVGAFADWLRSRGIRPNDRVAAVLPNVPEAIIGLLGSAAVGAVWTINSPDLSAEATLGRLRQLQPRILIAADTYSYNGKPFDVSERLAEIEGGLPGLEATVIIGQGSRGTDAMGRPRTRFDEIVERGVEPRFERVPFSHPLWVLFSSGTTGAPKGIVHGHGGILLEAVKGPGLNQDMGPDDRYYVAANTSWMVWNTLVTNLATGASVVTYSGSPTFGGADRQFRILARTGATMFATGAAYLQAAERAGVNPRSTVDLSALRSILSTGSPLPVSTWLWVHREVKPDVHLGSDTGGTDICSGFIGSNPLEPVHAGHLQGPLLGVAVEAWGEDGQRVIDEVGDLVVRRPMPSMPLFLWDDPGGEKYRSAYFDVFPGVWTQGDWITETASGEFIVHGRSDATLNRQGVRIGPSDIYAALRDVPEIRDSLVIGVELPGGGYYMPLFIHLAEGATLDNALSARIASVIRTRASARHVPDEVLAVPGIPVTHANKKLEVPIKRLFSGQPLARAVNLGSIANPESVAWFANRAAQFRRTLAE
ncbi:MAG TPA: acetoacetate--CoA ligase [Microbacterium sp.]|uniref:acetoacetate--CoA ligase n=1 Tax=Microbacterium sp. TaxID=51671 RepID=UPI002C5933B5|nr:acetoacetate--CoA ligase [Microbacterium sp.]HWI30910.1 acetoacetate--CoA ligase [Microbacterium sp.]